MEEMQDMRAAVASMLDELGISQAEMCRIINAQAVYRVTPSEMSNAIKGALATPKGNRIVVDCYTFLERERRKGLLARVSG